MKKLIVVLMALGMILITSPVRADDVAFVWGSEDCTEFKEDLNRCGQKVVQLGQELEKVPVVVEDAKKDGVATGVVVGGFVGAGGAHVLTEVIGTINPVIGVAAFLFWAGHQGGE